MISEPLGKVPIVLFIHARPEETQLVMQAIARYRPAKFYVVADGPRPLIAEDEKNCRRSREISMETGWGGDSHHLFRDKNLGMKESVSQGLDWFFSEVDFGIILEDDVLPSDDFFKFVEETRELFELDPRIGMITGNLQARSNRERAESYFFSGYFSIWGWATWSKAWKERKKDILEESSKLVKTAIARNFSSSKLRAYFLWAFWSVKNKNLSTWDYEWVISLILQQKLCVTPARNLTQNIGFGDSATNTKRIPDGLLNTHEILSFPLVHNYRIANDQSYERALAKILPERRSIHVSVRRTRKFIKQKIDILYLRLWRTHESQGHIRR